ncbi:MAG: hypothetical protein HY081_00510 [Gammaproteobacteria bacterium]|nr:hypothetical protein [Gammaproteobacteria bacterium]
MIISSFWQWVDTDIFQRMRNGLRCVTVKSMWRNPLRDCRLCGLRTLIYKLHRFVCCCILLLWVTIDTAYATSFFYYDTHFHAQAACVAANPGCYSNGNVCLVVGGPWCEPGCNISVAYGWGSPDIAYIGCQEGIVCPYGQTVSMTTGQCTAQAHKSFGPTPPGQCAGNPCNAATGNKYQSETDYRGADSTLALTRYYNSQLMEDIGLGQGWSAWFLSRLEITGSTIIVRRDTGQGLTFTCSGSTCTSNNEL